MANRLPPRAAVQFGLMLALVCTVRVAGGAGLLVQVQDGAGKPLPDVIVYAEADGGAVLPRPLRPNVIEQRSLQFMPLVSAVQTGSLVSFPNNDKVRHHIYSFSPAHKFDQKLYSGTSAEPQLFDKAGLVVLGCNIHDKMVAYLRIVDTPYYAKTDANGAASLEIPAGGTYVLKAWHYDAMAAQPAQQAVTIKPGAPAPVSFKLPLKTPAAASHGRAAPAGALALAMPGARRLT